MSALRGLGALIHALLLETWRSKLALFWTLAFPLLTLAGFSYLFGGGDPRRVLYVVPGVLTINLISASFFGVSLYMVSLREKELYRRFRTTPLGSLTVVLAHGATALVNVLLSSALQLALAWALFRIELRSSLGAVALAVLLSALAMIPLGLLVGSVAKDMKSAPAISNLLFFPMMFLSGAAMPLFLLPAWMRKLAALFPASYCVEVLQAAILRGDLWQRLALPAVILLGTGAVALAADALLFRWESQEPLNRRRLSLTLALLAGIYGVAYFSGIDFAAAEAPEERAEAQPPAAGGGPAAAPARPVLGRRILHGMTVLDGTGRRLEHARLTLEGERILALGPDQGPLPEGVQATDLSGLFLVPGLIDSHVHVGGSPGGSASGAEYRPERILHDLQVYLALGVTSVVSLTDDIDDLRRLREGVAAGTMRSPRPFYSGPGITAPGGHPAKYFALVPGLAARMTRQVSSPAEARAAVEELAALRVDLVKLFLEGGWNESAAPVLARGALEEAVRAAHELGRKTTVHVDSDAHARLALGAGTDGLEHVPPDLAAATAQALAARRVTLTPTLTAYEGLARAMNGEPFTDPLVTRWVQPSIVASLASPNSWIHGLRQSREAVAHYSERTANAFAAARRAAAAGVPLLAGSDAGNPGAFHGAGLIRELELLVEKAGLTPEAALQAATGAAAARLGTTDVGRVIPGAYADLLVLKADPSRDIHALREVEAVYFGGVALPRDQLLTTAPGNWMPGRPAQAGAPTP